MARYRGPQSKIARKFKEPIFGYDKTLDRKPYPPGMHGPNRRKGKKSEFAVQLNEKQKVKYTYGVLERQFRNIFHKAASKKGITGENLLMLLESRLDNTVFRLGIAPTRRAARQLVLHKHIMVNDKVVNVSSFTLRPGDKVAVREKARTLLAITDSLSRNIKRMPWLDWDGATMTAQFASHPRREDIPENIKEQLIVELYSK